MKAEEYLKKNKFQNQEYAGYDVALDDAREAVKMARKEEREKSIEVARTIIHPMSENGEQENRIMTNFRKLLIKK
ncbi:MAG: hypothetical protein WCS73_12470 [Lentisphaeria bacterium]